MHFVIIAPPYFLEEQLQLYKRFSFFFFYKDIFFYIYRNYFFGKVPWYELWNSHNMCW